jgi:SAM-dependent methyltransferase
MHALESDFWWFVGMRRITGALLRRHLSQAPNDVLDMGCGTGINLLWMSREMRPRRVIGCDYSSTALSWCRQSLLSARVSADQVMPRLAQGDVRRLPFESQTFDLLTNLDVLDTFGATGEDLQAIKEFYRVLRPGGIAFVRAPAYQWLISSHDVLFETKHRYTAAELSRKMSDAGFKVVTTGYANTVLFPVALFWRVLRKIIGVAGEKTDAQPWPKSLAWLNGPFKLGLFLEAIWLRQGFRLPFGLSAICVGIRPPVTASERH